MPLWAAFCGGTYQARSPSLAADQAVNVYVETRQEPGVVKQGTLYGTPGRAQWLTLDTAGNRDWFTQDGRTWTVSGNSLYELDTTLNTATLITSIPGAGPVSYACNGAGGDQLGIVGGDVLTVVDLVTGAVTVPTLPFAGPVIMKFLDGYGLINQSDSPIVWFSALEDFETWDALDFFTRSETSDNIIAIGVSRARVWAWGSKTTTLFYDSGDADTPFVPYPGTTIQMSLVAPHLVGVYNDVFYWVGATVNGEYRVVSGMDPQATPISSPPIDRWLATVTDFSDARLMIYEQESHPFMCLTCPSSTDEIQTYCYDAREQLWHARAGWDDTTGTWAPWSVSGTAAVDGVVYVGDVTTGVISTLDLDTDTDNGDMIVRERTAPYLGAENEWLFLDQFELGSQPGVGLTTGQGSDPQAELLVSRDGAQTWTSAGFASLGVIGAYTTRTIWRRLGRVRADRLVLKVRQTDPVKCVWGPGAWLRVTSGTQQL